MKNITIADIAREAGVSKATVSRVISNPDLVKPVTRDRIHAIMDKYSYIPNQLAQNLAGTPTKTIGIVIDELSNFFFIEVAEGVDQVVGPLNYSMQLSSSRWQQERETQLIRSLISSRVDGILLAPIFSSSESLNMLKRSRIPFLLINCIPDEDDIAFVSCDNIRGGQIAADFINRNKREKTIIITGFNHQTLRDRVSGFEEVILPEITVEYYTDIKTFEDGYDLVPILLARDEIDKYTTTLFVTNDNVAIGIINHLLELQIPIPEQISIIGYDNIRMSEFSQIPLTTISQSIRDLGRIAALELMEMIKNPSIDPPKHIIKPKLIVRKSTC